MQLQSAFNKYKDYMRMYRPMTEGERAFASKIFKNLDFDLVRIYNRRIWPGVAQSGNRAVAFRNNTSFPGQTYSDDFSKSHFSEKRGVFIHELYHTYQHQKKTFNHTKAFILLNLEHFNPAALKTLNLKRVFNYQAAYPYELAFGKDLKKDYGFEQQPAIVQDYYMLTEEGVLDSFKGRRLNNEKDPDKLLGLYESVMEDFLNPSLDVEAAPTPLAPR